MERKVKTFLHVFTQSLFPQRHYYRNVIKTKVSFSVKYFVTLIFILSALFFAFFFSNSAVQPFGMVSVNGVESALKSFPADLSIEIKKGTLTTNYDRPYLIWNEDGENKFLIAVVNQTATPQQISEFETPLLLTAENIVLSDEEKKIADRIWPYGNLNLTVDKQFADELLVGLERIKPFLTILFLLFVLGIAPFFTVIGSFAYVVVLAFVCYLAFWLFSRKHSYKRTLQVSLHAATLPFLTKYGLLAFGYNLDLAWPVFAFLVVVFVLSGLYEAYLDK